MNNKKKTNKQAGQALSPAELERVTGGLTLPVRPVLDPRLFVKPRQLPDIRDALLRLA
jgi:hypothetical protein